MDTLIRNMVGSLVRLALGGLVGWLIEKGIMQPDQEAAFYTAIVAAVVTLGWAAWENIIRQRVLNTAASLPPVALDVVKTMVKEGIYAPAVSASSAVPNDPTPGGK